MEKLLGAQNWSLGSQFSLLSRQPLPLPLAQPLSLAQQKGPGGSKGPELSHLVVFLEKQRQGLTFLSVLSAVPSLPWEGEREKESFS